MPRPLPGRLDPRARGQPSARDADRARSRRLPARAGPHRRRRRVGPVRRRHRPTGPPAIRDRVLRRRSLDDVLPEFYRAGARDVCARPRPATLRRADDGGRRPAPGQAGADGHRRRARRWSAVLPAALNALAGRGVHILTANDYLARRDAAWMGPVVSAPRLVGGLRVAGHEPRRSPRRVRGRRHVRDREGGGIRLPSRPDDDRGRRCRAAAVPLRHRGRGRLHPDRRGARAARDRGRGAVAPGAARGGGRRRGASSSPGPTSSSTRTPATSR